MYGLYTLSFKVGRELCTSQMSSSPFVHICFNFCKTLSGEIPVIIRTSEFKNQMCAGRAVESVKKKKSLTFLYLQMLTVESN